MASNIEREAQQAITLIKSFNLELAQYSPESQVLDWLQQYRALWIRDAIIEAVYQGRYKVISVEQILSIWKKRGQPVRHFTNGFEQVIATQLGTPLRLPTNMMAKSTIRTSDPSRQDSNISPNSLQSAPAVLHKPVMSPIRSGNSTAGMSIEAFPVAAFETLVEVYQASDTSRPPAYKTVKTLEPLSFDDLGVDIPNFNRDAPIRNVHRARPIESDPIQPFRPIRHRQRQT